MRKGIYKFNPEDVGGIGGVDAYVGLHISNTIIGFLFVMIIVGMTTFPIFWPLFWIAIWNYFTSIILLIVLAIVSNILTGIAISYIIRDHFVYNRRSTKYSKFYNFIF